MAFEGMSEADAVRLIRTKLDPKSADIGKATIAGYNLKSDAVGNEALFISACRVTGTMSIPHNTTTIFNAWGSVQQNPPNMFITGVTTQITVPRLGYYWINCAWDWVAAAGGSRYTQFLLSGVNSHFDGRAPEPTFGDSAGSLGFLLPLTAGTGIGVSFFQNKTAVGALSVNAELNAWFVSN